MYHTVSLCTCPCLFACPSPSNVVNLPIMRHSSSIDLVFSWKSLCAIGLLMFYTHTRGQLPDLGLGRALARQSANTSGKTGNETRGKITHSHSSMMILAVGGAEKRASADYSNFKLFSILINTLLFLSLLLLLCCVLFPSTSIVAVDMKSQRK